MLTFALEAMLSKQRILEIYLNSVEWGEGVFGAEAAARHYYRKSAAQLTPYEAARLAVMLPRPKYFEKVPNSGYLASRAGTDRRPHAGRSCREPCRHRSLRLARRSPCHVCASSASTPACRPPASASSTSTGHALTMSPAAPSRPRTWIAAICRRG